MTMSVRIPWSRTRELQAIEALAMKLKSRLFLLFFFMAYVFIIVFHGLPLPQACDASMTVSRRAQAR
jgi:hypothetical protein